MKTCFFAIICAGVAAAYSASSPAASSSTTVSAEVASATSLDNSCHSTAATSFGSMTTLTNKLTAIDSSVCRVDFSSSNSSATLMIRKAGHAATAMTAESAGWTQRDNGGGAVPDVGIATQQIRFAVEGFGRVLRTTDSGATWTEENAQALASFTGLDVVDSDTAYAVGWEICPPPQFVCAVVRKRTSGGGPIWAPQSLPAGTHGFEGIDHQPSDPNTLVAVGWQGEIVRTIDGGANWTSVTSPTTKKLIRVEFLNNNVVIAAGEDGTILRSTNAGASWATVSGSPTSLVIADIEFSSGTTAWILTTTNLWRTLDITAPIPAWTSVRSSVVAMTGVTAASANDVWVASWAGLAVSNNANDPVPTWNPVIPFPPMTVWSQRIAAYSATDVTIGGWGGQIYRIDDGVSMHMERFASSTANALASAQDVILGVGDYGYIRRSADAGATWSTVVSGTTVNLAGVTFVSDTVAIAVGTAGTILRSTDAGVTWTTLSPGFMGSPVLRSVSAGNSVVMVAGSNGFAARSFDSGLTWNSLVTGTVATLYSVAVAPDKNTVWVAGASGTILRSTDYGSTWVSQSVGGDDLFSISAPGSDVAWAAGNSSRVLRTTNQGNTWTQLPAIPALPAGQFNAIDAIDHNHAVVVGGLNAQRAITHDGGATWNASSGFVSYHSALMVDANTVYSGYVGGAIIGTIAGASVPNYQLGTADWSTSGGMFGVCLQDVGLTATPIWVKDSAGTPNRCEDNNLDPWYAISVAPQSIASTPVGGTGRVDLVWGLRTASNQPSGKYNATVEFIVLVAS